MNRSHGIAICSSAALHAAVLASALLSGRFEERAVLTVDVAWEPSASHSSSMSPSGLTRGPSSDLPARGTVPHGEITAGPPHQVRGRQIGTSEDDRGSGDRETPAHPSRRDFAKGKIAPQDAVFQIVPPHPEEPGVAHATAGVSKDGPAASPSDAASTPRETTETSRSSRRR